MGAFWRTVTQIDKSKINSKWMASRNALAVAVPLGIGIAIGKPLGAVAIATGALNVSYSDGRDPYRQRARRMLTWTFLGAAAVFVGSVTGKYHFGAILIAAIWAFLGGMCIAISTRAGDLGLNTLVTLIVFAARGAMPLKGALISAGLVLSGGLLQTGFALLFWPLRRYSPERRAIGQLYFDLAKELDSQSDSFVYGSLKKPSPQLQDTLAALERYHSIEGERFRMLFDQADRIRLSVILLDRIRSELRNTEKPESNPGTDGAECITQLIRASSKLLKTIGHLLISGEAAPGETPELQQVGQLVEYVHALQDGSGALAAEAGSAADALAGQLRAVTDLANHSIPEGLKEFSEREAAQPRKLQIASWFATLRANLNFQSSSFRHALRLAVCVSIADALGRSVSGGQRSYWLPMTVAVVLKPDFTTTFSRGALRLLGTFAGLIVATVLYHAVPASPWRQVFLVGIFTFALRWMGPANYGIFSVAISGLIVFLVAAIGVPPGEVVLERAIYTAAGGVFALIAYAAWPSWERTQVSDVIADMLDACRAYFHAVVERFETDDVTLESNLDRMRRALRLARSNAEASVDRVSSEPKISAERLNCLNSILASSHALMHAMMGLEAGVIQTPVRTTPEVFKMFAKDVEFTLYFVAAALRDSSPAVQTLPKLRDDHRRLVQARNAFSPADQFLLIETDRITTSLNTLREQVMRYVSPSS
jgi:uncharacterized membrane protein YccC